MARSSYFYILVTCILLGGCHHENMQSYPEEFQQYVDEFFYQANLRGYDLYAENFNFSIQFGETDDGVGGFCNTKGNAITINPEDWEHRDEQQREHSIFHELGHCILNRVHRNEESTTNECYSYMKGTENGFDCSLNLYSAYWRDYYLDELFDHTTELPGWYLTNQDYANTNMSYNNAYVVNDTLAVELENTTLRFNQKDTFLFEITFHNFNTETHAVSFNLGDLRFAHCDLCTSTKTSLQLGNTRIYGSSDITINADTKFSVFKNNDIVSFYVNEFFVHAMEYEIIEGNKFKTESFDELMGMSIRYVYN